MLSAHRSVPAGDVVSCTKWSEDFGRGFLYSKIQFDCHVCFGSECT